MMNYIMSYENINKILNSMTKDDISKYIGTEELRYTNGKKLKALENIDLFYISIRAFNSMTNMNIQTSLLTSLLHAVIPNCCIARLTKNVSYILLYIENGKFKLALQSDLSQEELDIYKRRLK